MPGSVVISDELASYQDIPSMPGNYQHRTVDHGRHFVEPATGSHTNNVQNYCSRAKAGFKRMHATSKNTVPSHLNEFMLRERFGCTFDLAYLNILRHIAERYPC